MTTPTQNDILTLLRTAPPRTLRPVIITRFAAIVIPVLGLLVAFSYVSVFVFEPTQTTRLIPGTVGIILLTISWLLIRKGMTALGGGVLLSAITIAVLSGMFLSGGVRAPAAAGLIPGAVIAASLFGNRVGVVYFIFSAVLSLSFVFLERFGVIIEPAPPGVIFIWTTFSIWLFLSFVAAIIPVGLMHEYLAESDRAKRSAETAKQQAEATLHQAQQFMGLLEPDGTVVVVNETALKFIGASLHEVVGKPFHDTPWWPEAEKHRVKNAIVIAARGEAISFKTWNNNFKGEQRIVDFSAGPYRDENGKVVYLIAEGRDITDIVRAEERLAAQEKLESIGQLAGGVAHDFNNMLGGILGAADVMSTNIAPEDEKLRTPLNTLILAAERAASLTRRLLEFSRAKSEKEECVNFHTAIEDSVALLRHALNKRVEISLALKAANTSVFGNVSALQNVLLNMAINAGDAMPNGGTITIKTDNIFLDPTYCKLSPFSITPGEYLHVQVKDTGEGMPPEVMKRIFDPFFTTKQANNGTGLGLSTSYGTVRDHAGALTVSSAVGEGTCFDIYLPTGKPKADAPKADATRTVHAGNGCILVIDDEELIRETIELMLTEMGYTVLTAVDGVDGVSVFTKKKDEIDLVIVDMIMPRMDGLETYRKLRAVSPTVPVISASGFHPGSTASTLKEEGVTCFLEKPFRRETLVEALKTALG